MHIENDLRYNGILGLFISSQKELKYIRQQATTHYYSSILQRPFSFPLQPLCLFETHLGNICYFSYTYLLVCKFINARQCVLLATTL